MSAESKRNPAFVIDRLIRESDFSEFDCGNSTLNLWLRKYAWTNQQADSAKTYVARDGKRIVGYCALTTGSVHKHESPERIAKGLAHHPIGIVLLARLAVDQTQQGRGLGKALLFDALSRIAEAADIVAVRAVMVHAIDDVARRFYQHFGFDESPVDPYQLLLLLKDLRKAIHRRNRAGSPTGPLLPPIAASHPQQTDSGPADTPGKCCRLPARYGP
jgi:GNAT superfamily N-acetyltransferase